MYAVMRKATAIVLNKFLTKYCLHFHAHQSTYLLSIILSNLTEHLAIYTLSI